MTGVDTDLATLRYPWGKNAVEVQQAAKRVEAELSRLREQITELLQQESFMERKMAAQREDIERLAARVEAAEARCAHLQDANDRLLSEKARLQQALAHALDCKGWGNGLVSERGGDPAICTKCEAEAREALAGLDTPADSQEDEWFIPEGDRQCGVVHKMARATCMKRRGHDGSHATPQGTWIDGPWCEYPADSQEDKT